MNVDDDPPADGRRDVITRNYSEESNKAMTNSIMIVTQLCKTWNLLHKYAPISDLVILWNVSTSPSNIGTVIFKNLNISSSMI